MGDSLLENQPPPVEISIVLPVYDEEESLPVLAGEITAAMEALGRSYEVLYVDDGSTDGSLEALRRIAATDRRARLIRLCRNQGQSAALWAGFRRVRGDLVITLDSDLQNDPADIPRLIAALEEGEGCDMVSGVRATRKDSWVRRLSSRIANRVRSAVTGDEITDVGCSLKAYRAELIRELPFVFKGMHRFLPALVGMRQGEDEAPLRIREITVNHRARRYGKAKYGIGNRLFRALADLAAVRWMSRRWIDPRLEEEITELVAGGEERAGIAELGRAAEGEH